MPARNRPFSLEQKAQVAALRSEGRSVAEIAGIIGRNYKSVENLITREGYRSQPVAPPEPVSSFQLDVPVRPFAVRVPTPPPSKDGRVFTALVYGDSHVPFHDTRALDIVKSIAKAEQPDVILNVGDLVDSWQISRFDKDPTRQDSLQDNIDEARQHLAELALLSPRSRRVLLEGNHEARLARTIWRMEGAARELPKLRVFQQQMTWPKLLETDAIGWEWVGEREQSRTNVLPKLITKHGTVVRKWSGTTARGEWEKYGHSGLSGHTHRLGEFLHRDHNGTASWIETGCTCDLDPPYGTDFDWQQGCVFVVWNKDRRLMQAELVKIRDGSALFQRKTIEPRKVA